MLKVKDIFEFEISYSHLTFYWIKNFIFLQPIYNLYIRREHNAGTPLISYIVTHRLCDVKITLSFFQKTISLISSYNLTSNNICVKKNTTPYGNEYLKWQMWDYYNVNQFFIVYINSNINVLFLSDIVPGI